MKLQYGNGICCELDSSSVTRITAQSSESVGSQDVAALVRDSLANPLDYPALASATVPGDCVAVTLEYGTACLVQVLEGVLAALKDAGVDESRITVLLAQEFEADEALRAELRRVAGDEVALLQHQTDDDSIAMLAVSPDGEPIRLNRALCDADVVIPVASVSPDPQTNDIFKSLYPRFSDDETMSRFRNPAGENSRKSAQAREKEVEVLGRFLGLGLVVQVVPGPADRLGGVCVGTPEASARDADAKYRRVWSHSVDKQGSLVIATVVGGSSEQTWESVARAIRAAESLVQPDGAIAICSELATPPGAALSRLIETDDYASVEHSLARDRHPDRALVRIIYQAIERGTVYLRSRLAPSLVESLGMAPIETDEELDRLVASYQECIVLEEAQRLIVSNATGTVRADSN